MSTYYVSDNNGSDTLSRSGGLSDPWKSVPFALAQAGAGDMVLVRGGTYYRQAATLPANNMTLQAYDGETVWLDGGWDQNINAGIWAVPDYSQYPVVGEFDGMINVDGDDCVVDGINVKNSAARGIVVEGDDAVVKNLDINKTCGTSVLLYNTVGGLVQDVRIMLGSMAMKLYLDGLIGNWPHTVAPRNSLNTIWRRVEIYESEGEGFSSITGYGALIEGCKIVNCSKPMIYVNVSPGMVVRNTEIYCTAEYTGPRFSSRGFSVTSGIKFADEEKAVSTAKYGTTRNVEIYNNVIAHVAAGLGFAQGSKTNSTTGITTYQHGANAVDCLIANNTFLCDGQTVISLQNILQDNRTISNTKIENNIFVGKIYDKSTAGNKIRNLTFRYNYWSNTPTAWMQHGSDTSGPLGLAISAPYAPSTVSELSTTNHDDIDATDYHLTASSPAVDAALANKVTTDYLGNLRGASPDQGWHEYDGTEPDPDVTLAAGFTMSADRVEESTAVTLTDTSTISAGAIDSWTWEYKLTSASSWTSHDTGSSPSNLTIATAGEYQVRLTVTDTETSQSSQYVLILTVTAAGEDEVDTCTGNLLTNADFASGTTGWSFSAGTGGSGSWGAGSGYADVTATTPSSTMQLFQNGIDIVEGTQYRLAFRAKGGQARTIRAFLFDNTSIRNLGIQAQDFDITTNWLAYEFIFVATASSSSNARLQLRVGLSAGSVQIDDLCLAEYTPPALPEAIVVVPSYPATVGVEQTLSGTSSTGSPTAYSWKINGVEVGTGSTYAWTPASQQTYTISLTVTNAYGSDETTVYVEATAPASGGGGGGAVAALLAGAVPGSTGSDGGTTHADVGTNTGGLLMLVSGATAVGTAAADAEIGIGASDGTNGRAVTTASQDVQANVYSGQESEAATAYLVSPLHTKIVDGDAAFSDSETVEMTWNTVSAGKLYAALRIAAQNVAVGDFVPGGADVNVGFQPDIVFCFMGKNDNDFAGTGQVSGNISFGFVTADGTRGLLWRSTTGTSSGNVYLQHSETYVCGYQQATLVDGVAATINSTGFSHSTTGSMTGKVGYLALKLDGLSTQIVDFDTKTSTGTQSHSADFEAGAAVMLASLAQTIDTVEGDTDASVWSLGFWDGTNERASAISDQDGAATTVCKSIVENALLTVPSYDGSDNILATVDSVTSSTFVLDYANADSTARKASMLLIEAPAASTRLDFYQRGLGIGTVAGMP